MEPRQNSVRTEIDTKIKQKMERDQLCLWKSPLLTLYYFFLECLFRFTQLRFTVLKNRTTFILVISIVLLLVVLDYLNGPHSQAFGYIKSRILWWSWWVWLGFLSSCGFGTGLHTFVLYLGPFIAEITMSAYECGSLQFPRPPYPDKIICPDSPSLLEKITFWKIMRKVQVESIMWGLGTALGELPPYFMARGARLSGEYNDELSDFQDVISSNQDSSNSLDQPVNFQKRVERFLHYLILRAGFVGILLCASIPNPLFDLAGVTCGHFLVSFWSFFGATFIGKALIKVHLQQLTVIALSSEHHVETLVELISRIPVYGKQLQSPFLEYLHQQKASLHNKEFNGQQSWLQMGLFIFITALILSFVVSIIHAFARSYHRRLCDWRQLAEGEIHIKDE
ncbi:Vacuole membrane protein isoform 1 [Schistosoma japonicum]|uniref:Vacuole membrane protein isoform 1 n=1 Tax=Schistosoma japonicum TaxID=6182 RepID=A0A4Z2CS58_SCHJA|nr:Vacuole membrane protein isoform 1 [Schistosoma japonicum]